MALTKLTDIRKSLSVEVEDLKVNGITTFTGSVSIGGTLTYEDVTNIDAIGIITARSGIIDNTLTSGRILYSNNDNRIVDSSNLTYDGTNVTTTVSGNSGIVVAASGNNAPQIRGQANRGAQNNTLLSMHGVWDGTDVAMIDLQAGPDTTNKDDGQIGFYTRPSGSSMAQRLHINSSGQTIINSSGTESGTIAKLAVCATGSPGSNPSSIQNNTIATFRATGSSAHAASIAVLAGNGGSSAVHFGDTDNDVIGRLIYNHTSGNTSDYFEFYLQGSRRFRIQGNGNLCIGNDSNFTAGAKVEIRDTIGGGGGTGLILNDIGSSGANEGLHIEWRSGSDKQSDQCRIGQNSNSTGSGSHFFIATNPGDTGSSQTRLVIGSAGQFGIGGFTYGTAGQVLTSGGASSPPTWSTPSGVTIANNADNKVITGGSGTNLNAEGNVYIDSNGKMSIGASSADRILDIHQSTTNAYSATGYSAADNTLLRIHNPSGTDNSGVGYHTGLEFIVASGANSVGQIGVVRTGNNIGDFFFKHRTGASSYRETLRVKSDNTTLLGGYQGTGAPNSDIVNENVIINCSSTDGYDNRHTVSFGQLDGNWTGSGSDVQWGMMWHYAPNSSAARECRAGIVFDHANTEEFKIWSGYGDIVFNGHSSQAGNLTAEQCNRELARFNNDGHFVPGANNGRDLGTSSLKWRNIYVMDMHFSNEGGSPNSVDGTTGNWTLQEGEDGIYMINNKNGKKYEMMLKEVQ